MSGSRYTIRKQRPLSGPVEYEVTCSQCGKTFLISKINELEFEAGLNRLTCPGGDHAFLDKDGITRTARTFWTYRRISPCIA